MTDREKLIDILMDELPKEHPWAGNVKGLVDTLIANGVVVREKGAWKRRKSWPASVCPVCSFEEKEPKNFCPNCGADMRRREK